MENPKYRQHRDKNFSPSKILKHQDFSSSGLFLSPQGYKSSNTPDYFKPKSQQKHGEKSEFTTSVQEFLKQSTEIQDEIRKLSEICQQISPKHGENKEIDTAENIDWERVSELVKECGFKPLKFENEEVLPESLAETFIEALYEFSSQAGILQQNKEELRRLEKENDHLIEINKELEESIGNKGNRVKFEQEIRDLERMSKNMETRFRKMKEKIKQKDLIIKDLRLSIGNPERITADPDTPREYYRLKQIFESFMYREFRENSENDCKIMKLIENYETKETEGQFQVILDELEVFSGDEALQSIAKLKQDSFIYTETEKFIQELYYSLTSRPLPAKFSVKYEEIFSEILQQLSEVKQTLSHFEELKTRVADTLQVKRNLTSGEILEKVEAIGHFRKLFSISEGGNEVKVIENLFLFIHEIKLFLSHARSIIGKESLPLSELLEEISQALVRTYE